MTLFSCKDCDGDRAYYRRYPLDNGWLTQFCRTCLRSILKLTAWTMHMPVVLGWDHKPWDECAVPDLASDQSTDP